MSHATRFRGGHPHFGWAWFSVHYVLAIEAILTGVVAFSLLDLWTSAVAIGRGLSEGNVLVIGVSQLLGVDTLAGLAFLKMAGIFGATVGSVIGVKTSNLQVRRLSLVVLGSLLFVLIGVAANNLFVLID